MTRRKVIAAALVTLGVAGAVGTASLGSAGAAPVAASAAQDAAPACLFTRGDTDAYVFESVVTADEASARPQRDRFAGVLSWVVVEPAAEGRPAILRASLAQVALEQSLTPQSARVDGSDLENQPFFVRIEESCRFAGAGYGSSVAPLARELVTTLLQSAEFVLPAEGSSRWQAEQRDGVGDYDAHYTLSREVGGEGTLRVVRVKPSYREDGDAMALGLRVQVVEGQAQARFDPRAPGWMQRVEGREHVRFQIPGEPLRGLVHELVIVRDGARYAAVRAAALRDADFTDASQGGEHDSAVDPALATLGHDEALALFLAVMAEEGAAGTYPAARLLADWLRQHPEGSAQLLQDLRAGAIDTRARASLFLALQLAGDDASRDVLVEATAATDLAAMDRARAAVALADHGEPTQEAADALLAQVRAGDSADVANVSLLGLGRMTARAPEGSPLRSELRASLSEELESATDIHQEIAVIAALGNTRDATFEDALEDRLHADDARARAHAAHALEHMPAERARPRLVEQLESEGSTEVLTSILRSLRGIDGQPGSEATRSLTPSELALCARLLATSQDVDVRAGAIEWLGRSADQREARAVLAGHFPNEPVMQLKQRIGAFVSAAELRDSAAR